MKSLLLVCLFFLISCLSNFDTKYSKDNFGIYNAPVVYTIKKGDTLFSIAWRFGLNKEDIQNYNKIINPNKIFVGQKIRLNIPSYILSDNKGTKKSINKKTSSKSKRIIPSKITKSTTYAISSEWVWPMRGYILRNFNPRQIGANGMRIAGKPNQTINAAYGGVVAYKGNGLNGYGNVVIIKHKKGLLSAYGFLSKTYVKEGQRINKRQKIGTVGYASDKRLMLHFEIRKNGRPVNPKLYIGNSYRF